MIIDCKQRSEEWFNIRLGKITGSKVHDILPGKTGKYKASRVNYMSELICEILTGQKQDNYISKAMEYGIETEHIARSAYEAFTGNFINEIGFVINDDMNYFGISPDGLLENKGIEIKCPNTATHINTLLSKKIEPQYYTQIQSGMICTKLKEWDFVSFDNRLPDNLQLFIKTIKIDDKYCDMIISEIKKFHDELLIKLEELKKMLDNGSIIPGPGYDRELPEKL